MAKRSNPPRANAVRQFRRRADVTQAQLAAQVDVSRQTIVSIESGGYAPSVYLALALAEQLGTSVEALFATGKQLSPASAGENDGTGGNDGS